MSATNGADGGGSRAERLAGIAADEGLDGVIVGGSANLRYIAGYTGSNGLALVTSSGVQRFLTDFRYEAQAAAEITDGFTTEIVTGDLLDALAAELPAGRIGFDDTELSVRRHARLVELAPDGVELVGSGGLVERLRSVKDADELGRIGAAAALVDGIYEWLVERGLAGRVERDVALELEHEMRRRGASGPSFGSIVASGVRGALPHATPTAERIEPGTLVTIDIGAVLDGYCSDCTRTFAAGGEPDGFGREIYDLVLEAQLAGLAAVAAGPTGKEVDAASRAVIEAAGYGERFGHGLGHGVGIEVHEGPRLSKLAPDDPLRENQVVTVEPGVYLPDRLGVRIEDLVVVRPGGCDVLSHFTKDLLVTD
ncbi:MAG TPA: Xaa-Pro peptidase family protein [Solirubrobacteraceae bacterium]|jgi:Xaa-Pro aminopeptidase|nr:Xaa-Pro peptidase family protein [Solirubrobacteraceae bacterium]